MMSAPNTILFHSYISMLLHYLYILPEKKNSCHELEIFQPRIFCSFPLHTQQRIKESKIRKFKIKLNQISVLHILKEGNNFINFFYKYNDSYIDYKENIHFTTFLRNIQKLLCYVVCGYFWRIAFMNMQIQNHFRMLISA